RFWEKATGDRLDLIASLVAGVADVERLMDVADPMAEEDEPLAALLVAGAVLQHVGMLGDSGEDAVVGAGLLRNGSHVAGDVEKVPVAEGLEVQPGAGRVVCLLRGLRLGAS